MKKISILGSTGSIGTSTLKVVKDNPDKFQVIGLAEGHDVELLAEQIKEFKPKIVSVRDEVSATKLKKIVSKDQPEIVYGIKGASLVASMNEVELIVSAIVGAAGLIPTVEAIKASKTIALANKETMVVGGSLVTNLAKKHNSKILPVDSEHSAIFQSLEGHRKEDVLRIILTASGGPFLNKPKHEFKNIKVEDALKHPKWDMGAKITIDSSTLMNKGLEVIEAKWLFDIDSKKIAVIVHPQSIVHSMVEYNDGCVIAELGEPDMCAPIAYAISYPERIKTNVKKLKLEEIATLTFQKPDFDKFPCLGLAYKALEQGRSYSIVLNAANEVAVGAFLDRKIEYISIPEILDKAMQAHDPKDCTTVEEILEIDKLTRELCLKYCHF